MTEIKTTRRRYTWSNNHTHSKIDWALGNSEWIIRWTHLEAITIDPGFSDHSPQVVEFADIPIKGARPFKFLNHLVQHPDFLNMVGNEWSNRRHKQGMHGMWTRLKQVKQGLKNLNTKEYSKIGEKVEKCRKLLAEIQVQSRDPNEQLISHVTDEEIFNALMDIDDQKAPVCDGFNAHFFKTSWQVITKRMQALMPELVDNSQSAFVLGRVITDNIILGHELVKGYGRKGISPKYMLKIDMQKAYDSVEWVFIEQGDKTSVQLLFNCFREFSRASGLTANLTKISVYFGGVNPVLQQQILAILGFLKGELPFRYLGVPLSSKRLSITQCQPLIDKMLGKIISWTSKFLSYAGRVMLIKSVLFAIQTYWSHVFVLPKRIINLIVTTCRRFLWTGDTGSSNKILLA
ncbi:uncharacterized protein [Nicotiana tomentosiformis]|uniref:uncharacterized protein n=1 Tax=Nicotiana tomentosiformis TaxID=4098 RepID=UPI00051C8E16|nr:uncharacterized protein LOC104086288 [Nicotiana tomentosiformis]